MKTIRNILIGLLFIVGISSCSTIGPPPDGPDVVYYSYPSYYYYSPYYRPVPPPRYYRPVPPPPKSRPNTPPPRPNNNGNRRHR